VWSTQIGQERVNESFENIEDLDIQSTSKLSMEKDSALAEPAAPVIVGYWLSGALFLRAIKEHIPGNIGGPRTPL